MKYILTLILSIITLVSCVAGEPVTFLYRGEVAGVMCSACCNHVETALSKLQSVQNVKVLPAKDGGIPKLEVTATNATLTKEDAVKALGDYAKTYDIRSLKLVEGK